MEKFRLLTWISVTMAMSVMRCGAILTTTCPSYVLEHQRLSCLCQSLDSGRNGTVTWPGHSDNGTLTVPNVQRAQNGTRYTCRLEGGEGGGEKESLTYTLLVAYGPSKEKFRITGEQQPFPTNGSQNLTLTCETGQVYPVPDYVWREVTCEAGTLTSRTCVVKPRPPADDGMTALCEVSRKYRTGLPRSLMTTEYHVRLTYPPLTAPQILIQAKDDNLLRKGDNLTCLIKGGKPGVSRVVFSCSSPDHADREDEKMEGGLRSTVSVSSLSHWRRPMRCGCRGIWDLKPDYYTLTADGYYNVEHPAVVTNFTIGGGLGYDVTVTGDANASVIFLCSAFGRPAPTVAHFSKVAAPASFNVSQYRRNSTSTGNWTTDFTLEMNDVNCDDMGRYQCSVENGVGDGGSEMVVFNVECGPSKRGGEGSLNMTERGIQFSLQAFPVPDHFTFHHLGRNRSLPHNGTLVDSGRFCAACQQDDVILYQVNCRIQPRHISDSLLGDYRVTIANSLGEVDVYFFIHSTVLPQGLNERDGLPAATIAGIAIGSSAGLVIIVIIVIALVFKLLQRRRRNGILAKPGDIRDNAVQYSHAHTVPMKTLTPSRHGPPKRTSPGQNKDITNGASNHQDSGGEIHTICTPRRQGPTSTPIKGSTMTESDLGCYSGLSARRKTPPRSKKELGCTEEDGEVRTVESSSADVRAYYASADEMITVQAVISGVAKAADASDDATNTRVSDSANVTASEPCSGSAAEEAGDGYASVGEVGKEEGSKGTPDEGRGQRGPLYAVSSPLQKKVNFHVEPTDRARPLYSVVHVPRTETSASSEDIRGSPFPGMESATIRTEGESAMPLEDYSSLCRQGKPLVTEPGEDNYNHIGNFAFTPT